MPLRIPLIFKRSRPRSTIIRTDLCTPRTISREERDAQGYASRSDWHNAIYILSCMLDTALYVEATMDWESWNIESEFREVRRFHFEDLDQTDQKFSPTAYTVFKDFQDQMESKSDVREDAKTNMEAFCLQLERFREQAVQLYGAEACAETGERLDLSGEMGSMFWKREASTLSLGGASY